MKKSELEKKLKDLDLSPDNDRLYRLNRLHVQLSNEFNESAKYYNRSIYVLTWIVAVLIGILVFK